MLKSSSLYRQPIPGLPRTPRGRVTTLGPSCCNSSTNPISLRFEKAEHYRRRVTALESNRAIFSDDPGATEKLVDKIERLKKRQGVMKRANLLIRKADREGLGDLGRSKDAIDKLLQADWCGRIGFSDYALKNTSSNIRRLEKPSSQLQKTQ